MSVTNLVVDGQRRAELGQFLRTRRQRVMPEHVGLPSHGRRRTPGLRREEVARLAGVGVSWYTWLEQGRPINASLQVFDAVAQALRLSATERSYLYRLAAVCGAHPPSLGEAALPEDTLTVLDALDPNPSCVYNARYDLLASNEAYDALVPGLSSAKGHRRNALWHALHVDGQQSPFSSSEVIAHMVAVVRANYSRCVGDAEWDRWIGSMRDHQGSFTALWESHDIDRPMPTVTRFTASDGTGVEVRVTTFVGVGGLPDARMLVYLPATSSDAAQLRHLRERRGPRPARRPMVTTTDVVVR